MLMSPFWFTRLIQLSRWFCQGLISAVTRFFFGNGLADRVAREGLVILPERTEIWWLTR